MKNSEKIRNMTDKELAVALASSCPYDKPYETCIEPFNCQECIFAWLGREADE